MKRAPGGAAGFSLIEALIALAIMTMMMSAFYATLSAAYRGASQVKIYRAALGLARSHLQSIGREMPVEPGISSGTFENDLPWRLTITALLPVANRPRSAAQPYLIVLETFDRNGRSLLRLETVKIGVQSS